MPHIIEITDLSAPELDVFARLTEAQLRSRRAPERALFIAESPKVIGHALDAGYEPVSLLMERRQLEGPARDILARCGDVPLYTAGRDTLAALTGYELTRGVLCAMRRPSLPAVEELCAGARRVAVLEGIVDPTNVGAIFRSAAALHMAGVLVTPTCCDPLHRRAVRVSMGTVFQIPWTRIGGDDTHYWPVEGLAELNRLGFTTAAMALEDDSISLDELVRRLDNGADAPDHIEKLALIFGTEGDGLSHRTIAHADLTVRIPMSHGVDSLNVAASSAVAFYSTRVH